MSSRLPDAVCRFACGILLFLVAYGIGGAQTAPLTSYSSNNTAACAAAGSPSHCQAGWSGLSDTASGTFDPVPGNVSTVDVHSLMYSGSTTKILTYFEPWFCMNSGSTITGAGVLCGQHIQVGYKSNDTATVHAQANDMIQRHYDGVVADWFGTQLDPATAQTIGRLRDDLNARCTGPQSCPLFLALMEDQGSFQWTLCPTNGNGTDQTNCIISALENDLDYMNANFFPSNAYMRVNTSTMAVTSSGRPVVLFFICEECFTNPAPNWNLIWNTVRTHTNTYGTNSPFMYFIYRNANAFSHVQTNGGFAWVNGFGTDTYGFNYLDNFYDTALGAVSNNPNLITFGAAWKGFDETRAPWNPTPPRVIQQQCGQTWLQSFQQVTHNNDFGSTHQLPFMGIVTWNDYEEGTETETGIDNCLSLSAAISGNSLTWTPTFSAASGSEATVHHYEIIESTDSANGSVIATVPSGTHSVKLANLALSTSQNSLYVRAVGQPSILNKMSNRVVYAPNGPAAVSVTPNTGIGMSQTFAFAYSSSRGYSHLQSVQANINTSTSYASSCAIRYDQASSALSLMNDAGTSWSAGQTVGTTATLQNSQCSVNVGTSSVSGSGINLTLNVSVTFTTAYAGTKNLYGYAIDDASANSGWQTLGTWTVGTPPPPPKKRRGQIITQG